MASSSASIDSRKMEMFCFNEEGTVKKPAIAEKKAQESLTLFSTLRLSRKAERLSMAVAADL